MAHPAMVCFQQPKPGSRPGGPSTGARPMPASHKVKHVQAGQQRPKPPPAKKSSGPPTGIIVREDDFEEDDVICID